MKLDEKLISLRKEKRLTQAQLAEMINVSRQAISRWELGESIPSTENLKYLSKLYNVPLDYLLNDAEKEPILKEPGEQRDFTKKRIVVAFSIVLVLIVVFSSFYFAMKAGEDRQEGRGESNVSDLQESDVGNESIDGFDLEW